ncbi:hypothetical protein, partial [Clostridium perfringens]|uniref:hypothetical protein n=1 Tax=Clostridium perfringens TaxID=1502 RepID=UPI002ACC0F98
SQVVLDKLIENNYIKNERQVRVTSIKSFSKKPKETMFGKEFFKAPTVELGQDVGIDNNTPENHSDGNHDDINVRPTLIPSISDLREVMSDSSVEETFWFEMRKSTGGSRNILDLSSTARLRGGTALNTRYYNGNSETIHGGVTFFDIDANAHNVAKTITISFNGNEYFPSTILYAPDNQSWRLQLKGESPTDNKALSQYGRS